MLDTFGMFAAYNRWANELVYAEAAKLTEADYNRPLGAYFGSLNATLNHVLVADRIWLSRFTGEGPVPKRLDETLFPVFSDLQTARETEDRRIIDWIENCRPADIEGTFTYTPMTIPEPVTQKLAPTLSHFFNHQTHHRGQAHMMLTSLGRPSLAMDLIYFQRTPEGKKWA